MQIDAPLPDAAALTSALFIPYTTVLASVCALIFVALTVAVVRLRQRSKVAVGDIKSDAFKRQNSSLTNFANQAPLVIILYAIAEIAHTNPGILLFTGAFYIFARLAHIYSLCYYEAKYKSYAWRMIGMGGSLLVIIALAGINLYTCFIY